MKTWDIFCRVIDNYGDIGVCWRLARQLANEHNFSVRLWVDELEALQHIWPETILAPAQMLAGVTVCIWSEPFMANTVADVVIEAFACHLSDSYILAMRQKQPSPAWFNLEYMSAESWIEGCHQLSSTHPQTGLRKTFYFPGFNEKTGGLLREQNLLLQRDAFNSGEDKTIFLTRIGIASSSEKKLLVSLFSYENTAIESLLQAWSQSSIPVLCLVPSGKTLISVNQILNTQIHVGESFNKGSLTLQAIPFLTQIEYDQLLWACDINFVRGEDSFVRAQWAGKPFVWHIYPQDDDAHIIKLEAFLDIYTESMDPDISRLIRQLWFAWNRGEDCAQIWSALFHVYPDWRKFNQLWCKKLASTSDLATNLVNFCQKIL